eukprot:jgi/Astpho2/6539/Aster-x1380
MPVAVVTGSNRGIGLGVDLLVLSAGIMHPDSLDKLQLDSRGAPHVPKPLRTKADLRVSCAVQFEVNALGPLRVVQALRHNLAAAAKVVFLASKLATFSGRGSGGMYGYRLSKLAVRGAAAALAQDLKPCGVSVITLHPGAGYRWPSCPSGLRQGAETTPSAYNPNTGD